MKSRQEEMSQARGWADIVLVARDGSKCNLQVQFIGTAPNSAFNSIRWWRLCGVSRDTPFVLLV
jgi:hypothetical protein